MRGKAIASFLLCALLLVLGAVPAQGYRSLLTEDTAPSMPGPPQTPPPMGEIEDACGLAVAPEHVIYVSDYYHGVVDTFLPPKPNYEEFPEKARYRYQSQIHATHAPEGPCGLALDSNGNLYANIWHRRVVRLDPAPMTFDANESTGVAVDGNGNVYVNDRTYVAVYESSGAPVLREGQPLRIGLGSLGDAYGLAVFAGKVYVPDAVSDSVKVYEPTLDPLNPILTIAGPEAERPFTSLIDGAVAVDPTNGHLLVVDNLQPGYEHPEAAVFEFDSSGVFLGRLPGSPIDAEPSGLAIDPETDYLFLTSGNDEEAKVFAYGPFTILPPPPLPTPAAAQPDSRSAVPLATGPGSAVVPDALPRPAPAAVRKLGQVPCRSRGRGHLSRSSAMRVRASRAAARQSTQRTRHRHKRRCPRLK